MWVTVGLTRWNLRRIRMFFAISMSLFCVSTISCAQILPNTIVNEFQRAGIEKESVGIVVQAVDEREPLFVLNEDIAFHPASIMKVVTTYAALELLGPHFRWKTTVSMTGKLEEGVLFGDLIIKGSGDPVFSQEDLWLLIRDIRDFGVHEIRGNLILDRSVFGEMRYDPAAFDGVPLKPYNAGVDGLLLNDKKVDVRFIPDVIKDEVKVVLEPRMDGIVIIPPVAAGSACVNWLNDISIRFDDRVAYFEGQYPLACGEKTLSVHPYQIKDLHYFGSVFKNLWRESGGVFRGRVMEGKLPFEARVIAQWISPALSVIVNTVNKTSNNVKARQLLLALGVEFHGAGVTTEAGISVVTRWLTGKGIMADGMVIENGSGLSREEKIAASTMAQILKAAYDSRVMPELISSLPIVGRDGTMSKRLVDSEIAGKAHVKTGAINNVRAIAGYVLARNGRRYLVVCIVNHPNAKYARPLLDGLLNWVYENG